MAHYSEEHFVEDYALTLFFTRDNYLKKVSAASLRSSNSEHKLKDGDEIVQEIETSNKAELLLFSDKCNVYKYKISEIADSKVSLMGEYLPNLLTDGAGREDYFYSSDDRLFGQLPV